ncbi:MAG TPA: hypothetical protein VM008_13625 [Phycisphaerae bacterium]|nr:hypothetical protein [Phycisphaerae bacterium]
MKCVCPACGRHTDIQSNAHGFFERCLRCGALIKAQVKEDAIVARAILTGRVREAQSSTGQIADLLSRPPSPIATAAAMLAPPPSPAPLPPESRLYDLVPAAPKSVTTIRDALPDTTPMQSKLERRAALRQQQQTLSMVTLFGFGMMALVAVGAIALKSRDFFLRSVTAAQPGGIHLDESK